MRMRRGPARGVVRHAARQRLHGVYIAQRIRGAEGVESIRSNMDAATLGGGGGGGAVAGGN